MIGNAKINYFELVEELNESLLMYDPHKKTAKIYWNGDVDKETAKSILSKVLELIEEETATRLLLSREFLSEFTDDARTYMESLLKEKESVMVRNLERVAIVKPDSKKGNLFASLVTSSIKLIVPRLIMKQFSSEEEASEWLFEG